jgi:hypothetical protein
LINKIYSILYLYERWGVRNDAGEEDARTGWQGDAAEFSHNDAVPSRTWGEK